MIILTSLLVAGTVINHNDLTVKKMNEYGLSNKDMIAQPMIKPIKTDIIQKPCIKPRPKIINKPITVNSVSVKPIQSDMKPIIKPIIKPITKPVNNIIPSFSSLPKNNYMMVKSTVDDEDCYSMGAGWASFTLDIIEGWNMISIPTESNFEEMPTSHYVPYYAFDGEYDGHSELINDVGYFVLTTETEETTFCKNCVGETYDLSLRTGWNLIPGPCCEKNVDILSSYHSGLYIYNTETRNYDEPETLMPGKSYWLFMPVDIDLDLELNCPEPAWDCSCDVDNYALNFETDAEIWAVEDYYVIEYGDLSCSLIESNANPITLDCRSPGCDCSDVNLDMAYNLSFSCIDGAGDVFAYNHSNVNIGDELMFNEHVAIYDPIYEIEGSCCEEGVAITELCREYSVDSDTTIKIIELGQLSTTENEALIVEINHEGELEVIYLNEVSLTERTIVLGEDTLTVRLNNAGQANDNVWACISVE